MVMFHCDKTSVDDVKVEGLNSFKTGLRKSGDTNATDPINSAMSLLNSHIIGLKELKAILSSRC